MKVTFVSNYINHHQIPMSEYLYDALGEDYRFVQTEPMEEERRAMGWGGGMDGLPWLVCSYEQPEAVRTLLDESDVVLFGGCEQEEWIHKRLQDNKPVLRYSERIYREGQWKFVTPRGLIRKYQDHTRFRKAPVYLLCAGAYVASDYHLIRAYPGKMLRFGYFTRLFRYENEDCHAKRDGHAVPMILWAGRFLGLKHPADALKLAADLKAEGFSFLLVMVGGGEEEALLKQIVQEKQLADVVRFTGFMKPDQVREHMEQADIFLFTSDHREGWGAVLNEAMNSGCAVVANEAAGASPYLVKDGENGFLYPNRDYERLKACVKRLLADPTLRRTFGSRAYETIRDVWNPQRAAAELLSVCRQISGQAKEGGRVLSAKELTLPKDGPCSIAPLIRPGLWNQRHLKSKQKPRKRIYVCHTMYHVYVSLLKEMALARESGGCGRADLALSRVFMDFGDLGERIEAEGIFDRVLALDERCDSDFPELMKYKKDHHNIVRHMINRMIYTKKYGKIHEAYIDIDFAQYEDIYVFCDSDPIGYYLSYKHIYYHAMEDGLDCLQHFDAAHVDNAGHFRLKAYLAARNLIFIQNGYGKYCLDFEMNDCSVVPYRFEKYKEVPRKPLERALTDAQKQTMLRIFLPDAEEITAQLSGCGDCVLFLTEAFPPEEDVRIAVCGQIIKEHCAGRRVVIKPHPRDDINYAAYYPQCVVIRGKFPIEVLNFIEGVHFAKAVSIVTSALDAITFADEKYNIGPQIWDAYEPKERHAFMVEGFMRRQCEKEAQKQREQHV